MIKICLTGGPCGGKSTAIAALEQVLSDRGYKVYVIPETATELFTGGISPTNGLVDFQKKILELQLVKEKIYSLEANNYSNSIVLCDRGIMDQLAYINESDLLTLLKEFGINDIEAASNRYDAVYHLVTAANGTDFYNKTSNKVRQESAEEALIKDQKTLMAWVGHPHLRVIDNSTGFEEKIQRLTDAVLTLLGEPQPTEIERKFLIKLPSPKILSKIEYISKSNIVQTYLVPTVPNTERRIRQRGTKEKGFSFYYTEKTPVKGNMLERIEKEKKITEKEYIEYMTSADPARHTLIKTRYCFFYKNQYFEMDIYPFSSDKAILEIELSSASDKPELPDYLEIIKEVTGDPSYRNSALAKRNTF